jgi:hypothetical protein
MTTQDYKISISGLLFRVEDTDVLAACYALLEKHLTIKGIDDKQKTVGYTPEGTPITAAQMEKEVLEAIQRVLGGQSVRHQDLLLEMENW